VLAVASQTWRHIDCENKQSVEASCVDVLFNWSERHDVESIEDHLYLCPTTITTTTTETTTTTNTTPPRLSADKARSFPCARRHTQSVQYQSVKFSDDNVFVDSRLCPSSVCNPRAVLAGLYRWANLIGINAVMSAVTLSFRHLGIHDVPHRAISPLSENTTLCTKPEVHKYSRPPEEATVSKHREFDISATCFSRYASGQTESISTRQF